MPLRAQGPASWDDSCHIFSLIQKNRASRARQNAVSCQLCQTCNRASRASFAVSACKPCQPRNRASRASPAVPACQPARQENNRLGSWPLLRALEFVSIEACRVSRVISGGRAGCAVSAVPGKKPCRASCVREVAVSRVSCHVKKTQKPCLVENRVRKSIPVNMLWFICAVMEAFV